MLKTYLSAIKGCLLVASFFCFLQAQAQITAPKYSNEFLQIGVGARALGMGNAQVSVVNDVTSGYWNPAGLLQSKHKYEGALMHSEYFAGIAKYDYAAFSTRIDTSSALGISILRYGVDDIPNTLELMDQNGNPNYDKVKKFSVSDYAFLISYAKKPNFLPGLSLGGSFKIIYRNVGPFANAWGFGIDAGAQYKIKKWALGLMLKDVGGTYNVWTFNTENFSETFLKTGNYIPENSTEVTLPVMIMGASRAFALNKDFGLLATSDLVFTFDGKRNTLIKSSFASVDPRIGIEANYRKLIYLRGGIGNFQSVKNFDGSQYVNPQPNFGLGIKIKMVSIDYALTNIGNVSEVLYSNVFSLKAYLQ